MIFSNIHIDNKGVILSEPVRNCNDIIFFDAFMDNCISISDFTEVCRCQIVVPNRFEKKAIIIDYNQSFIARCSSVINDLILETHTHCNIYDNYDEYSLVNTHGRGITLHNVLLQLKPDGKYVLTLGVPATTLSDKTFKKWGKDENQFMVFLNNHWNIYDQNGFLSDSSSAKEWRMEIEEQDMEQEDERRYHDAMREEYAKAASDLFIG